MKSQGKVAIGVGVGFIVGIVVTVVAVVLVMPGMMIVTEPSTLGFDETVQNLQQAIKDNGWSSPATIDLQKSMAKQNVEFPRRVKVVQLCKPEYAKAVLTTDRYVAALMPCAIAVWEDDDGNVQVSKMNTGLMGKMFGGTIAEVMGGSVAADEARIMAGVVNE